MTGMMEGTGRRGRLCREWMDDITVWCQTDVHRLSLLAQDRERPMKNDYEKCFGHLRALCPWIMMTMMITGKLYSGLLDKSGLPNEHQNLPHCSYSRLLRL